MPWSLVRRDGEFCVTKDDDGDVAGCHSTREAAEAQVRALYAQYSDEMAAAAIKSALMEVVDVTPETVEFAGLEASVAEPEEEGGKWAQYADGRPALAAGAIPVKPPKAWFEHEEPETPGPIAISADGRYSGYLALKDVKHIGFQGKTVMAPMGEDYSYFHLGSIETEEGEIVATGRITFDTGHADLSQGARAAAAHYDDTGAVGADVRVGEDRHGVWVAGALRPDLTGEEIRTLRAAPLSGDWRRIGDRLRLVAALAVNVPGFPLAMAASGDALIIAEVSNEQRKKELINRRKKQELLERVK